MPMKNPVHPGEIIREDCIKHLGLTVAEAASNLGVSRSALSRLINAKAGISAEMAFRLAKGFGSTPEAWLRMQMNYDLAQIRERGEAIDVKRMEPAQAPW